MPRDPKEEAIRRVSTAEADYRSAERALVKNRGLRAKAMKRAVAAGVSKAELARLLGVTDVRVSTIVRDGE